jgi:GAF domain-containing protein
MLLADRTVLLFDADEARLEALGAELKGHGARCFQARDAATAAWGARETLPDAIICALEHANMDAMALLAELRSAPEVAKLAAVGLASVPGLPLSVRERLNHGGTRFEKFLSRPARTADLVDALCCVFGEKALPARGSVPSVELITATVARHDYRHLLAALNAGTAHRYSALFRPDGVELVSVWTFDREHPEIDSFPLRLPVAATPCAKLLLTRRSLAVGDALRDRSLPLEQQASEMRAFVGVPLVGLDGVPFGALCHFDPQPREPEPHVLALLELAAKTLCTNERRRQPR